MKRKADRIILETDIGLRKSGYRPSTVDLLDVSTSGSRIRSTERLAANETVWLRLPGLKPIQAKVIWVRDWISGVEFARPLHQAVFDMLVSRLKS